VISLLSLSLSLSLSACGRLHFDPLGNGSASASDGAPDDSPMDDSPMVDAVPAACASAIEVTVGRTGPTSTCTHPDVIDSCAATATQEVVFKFTAPTTAGYSMAAYNPGTQSISNSTQILDANCMPIPGCGALFFGQPYAAGQVVYFVVEVSGAACAMIEFEIVSS